MNINFNTFPDNLSVSSAKRAYSGKYIGGRTTPFSVSVPQRKGDSLTISGTGRAKSAINHRNTSVDKSIDLQSYFDDARKKNEAALSDTGTSIDRNAVKFTDGYKALKNALSAKYAIVSKAASSYCDKEQYLQDKYFNKSSRIYESDLSESERSVGYRNEKSYLTKGSVDGVNMSDSLFRGIEINGDIFDRDRLTFERETINSQIRNIVSAAGISPDDIPDTCTFSVDPYSKEITVNGTDEDMKAAMESALNVGDNGKNLFLHIYHVAGQGGSEQITPDSRMKYQAFARVNELTGLDISRMSERDGTFFTDSGEDILDVTDKAIEDSVPPDYRKQMRDWVHSLISGVSEKGWNNIPDLTLDIMFGSSGLRDIGLLNTGILGRSNDIFSVLQKV